VGRFPLDWLWVLPISTATGLVLWTSIPYLLLERRVHWRRLLVAGGSTAVGMAVFAVATPIYMPRLMEQYTNDFGLFGITITLIGWLLAASFVLVATTAIGAEFDDSDSPWLMRLKDRFGLVDPGDEPHVVVADAEPRGLTSGDLVALVRVLVNWMIMAAAVGVATALLPGIQVSGGFATYFFVSLLVGLFNAVLGPLLRWLLGSQSWIFQGASALLVNGFLLAVAAAVSPNLDIAGLGSAVLGALVVAVAGTLLEPVVRPVESSDASRSGAGED
jgi:uncharacterized membrane protein YvlD (DUF360 family)